MPSITSSRVDLRTSSRNAAFHIFSDENAHAYFPNQLQTDRYGQMCFDFDGVDLNTLEISQISFNFYNDMPYTGMKTLQIYAISGNDDGRVISEATDISEVLGTQLASVTLSEPTTGGSYNYGIAFTGTSWGGALAKTVAYLSRLSSPSHVNFILICFDAMSGVRITDATMTITYTAKPVPSKPSFEQNGAAVSSVAKGSTVTIKTNRASDSYTHTLYYYNGDVPITIGTAGAVGASVNWTVPTTLGDSVTIYCRTYDDGTQIGETQSAMLVLTQSAGGGAPTINSISVSDADPEIFEKFGAYVLGKSRLAVSISATTAAGTTITGYRTTIDGQTYTGATVTTMPLMNAGSRVLSVTVTGSTGDVAEDTRNVSVLDYTGPTLTGFGVSRCDEDGNPDATGAYISLTASGEVASMGGNNDISAVIKHRLSGADTWSAGTELTVSGYSLDLDGAVISLGLDPNEAAYDFRIELADYFTTISQQTGTENKYPLLEFVKHQYAKFHVPVHLPDDSPLAVAYGGTGETSLEPLIQTILGRIPTPSIDAGASYVVLGSVCIIWGTAMIYSFTTNGSATVLFSDALPDGKTFSAAPVVHATPKWSMASTYGSIVSTYVQSVSETQAVICMEASRAMAVTGSEYFYWFAIGTIS